MHKINRFYYKCKDCFVVVATDTMYEDAKCDFCGGEFEFMGQVRKDHLVVETEATPCDTRCTHAQGPLCVCRCCGENHGSGRVVKIVKFVSNVPHLVPNDSENREQHLAMAEEGRRLLAEYDFLFAQTYPGLQQKYNNRVWINDRKLFNALWDYMTSRKKAVGYKTHKTRVTFLRKKIEALKPIPVSEVA